MVFWRFCRAAGALVVAAAALETAVAERPSVHGTRDSERNVSFERIEQTVRAWFESQPDRRPGDIITRSDAEAVFAAIDKLGWQPRDRDAILDAMLREEDFLVRQLRTVPGKKFMARIAAFPHAYDRLDHLARLPQGKQTVQDLIRAKGGEELIEYLTTAPGGTELGRMLSAAPGGKNFNRPTGRIYTTEQLLARLRVSYVPASAPRRDRPAE